MFEAWNSSFFSILLLLTGGFAIAVGLFAWNRRDTTGSFTLTLLMIAVAEWAIASSLESAASTIPQKILWAQISYLGIHSIPPLFLILSLQYNQNDRWLAPRRLLVFWLVPLIIMGLAFTNNYHNLIWTEFTFSPEIPNQVLLQYGAGFWIGAIYDYSLILIASINMVWTAQNLSNLYRRQVGAIVIAAALPWVGNLLYIIGVNPFPGQGLTSVTFLLMGIFLAWSMFRHQLFDFVPIAREKIVDKLSEIVIYVDKNSKIADANHRALTLIQGKDQIIGNQATDTLQRWPYLATLFKNTPENFTFRKVIQDKEDRWYDLRISPFQQNAQTQGWLIILRDITEQRELETALRSSEELYRNVTEKANDGIAILQQTLIVYCNPQLATMLGYRIDDLVGRPFYHFVAPEHVDAVRERHKRRMQGLDEPTRYESVLFHASGVQVPVEFNVSIMEHGGEPALLAIVRDITAQVEAETILLEHVRDQKCLNEITMTAIETSDLNETLQTLANRLGGLIHSDSCHITLWDQDTETAIPTAAFGPMKEIYQETTPKPDEPTLTEAVLHSQKPIIINDINDTPYISHERAEQSLSHSVLAFPLIVDDEPLGAAIIGFDNSHTFTDKEIFLSEQACRQVALAIQKARLLETAQQRAIEAETLRHAGAAVAATLKLDEAIDSILVQLIQVVPYDSASVQLLRDGELQIVGLHGFKDPHSVNGMTFALSDDNPNSIVLDSRQTYIINDAPKAFEKFKEPPHNHIRGWMGVPLVIQDRIIGMLALDSNQPGRFDNEHARLVTAFAAQVAIALDNANLYEETHRLAITDSLTGINNRRQFMMLAQLELQRANRYNRPLSIIMMDIDHFKMVNDSFGHLIGDQVLHDVAQLCNNNLREMDIMGRYGGEEFTILLPETPSFIDDPNDEDNENPEKPSAKTVAERLRKTISEKPIETAKGTIIVTASFGVVGLSKESEKIETLLDRADTSLYIAKQRGRNQVVVWIETQKKT